MNKALISALLGAAAASATVAIAPLDAHAACVPGGDIFTEGTNCRYFTVSSDSFAKNRFAADNIQNGRFFQVGFLANNDTARVTGVEWSPDNGAAVPWTPFGFWNDGAIQADSSGFRYTKVTQLQPPGTTIGDITVAPDSPTDFFVRFTIESAGTTMTPGDVLISRFVSSNIGTTTGAGDRTVLSEIGSEDYRENRQQEAAVPGPLPLLGAAAAFSASRRLRRRLKANTAG